MEDPNKHWCLFCKCIVPNLEIYLNEYYSKKMHRRLEKLYSYVLFFEEHGICPIVGQKTYECRVCSKNGIPTDVKKLQAHLFDVHLVGPKKKYPFILLQSQVWYSRGETPDVIKKGSKN